MLSGCATVNRGPSVCDVPETMEASFLCRAASSSGIPLEEYGYIILDAEAIALITEDITTDQVHAFCDYIRSTLVNMQGRLTYSELIMMAIAEARDRAIFGILSRRLMAFQSDLPISDIDIGFLIWQLDLVRAQI